VIDLVSGSRNRYRTSAVKACIHLNCPRCGLTIVPRASWLRIEHCPRCLARQQIAVRLFASTLATAQLYAANAAPAEHTDGSPRAPSRGT